MKKKETVVISLGGSLIVPQEINVAFLKKFRQLILNFIKKGNKVIIVCGGGKICRKYNSAAEKVFKGVLDVDLDWLGIAATKLNAELLRVIFSKMAYEKVLVNPSKKVKTNKKILIGSGYRPGSSSDKDAVLLAKAYGASVVINLTNVDYVYDKNPKKFKNAKPLKKITWPEFRKIVGTKWDPGSNVPFGPPAARLAQKIGLKVVIINGVKLKNLSSMLSGKKYIGSIIH
jgi:uridylate kinase